MTETIFDGQKDVPEFVEKTLDQPSYYIDEGQMKLISVLHTHAGETSKKIGDMRQMILQALKPSQTRGIEGYLDSAQMAMEKATKCLREVAANLKRVNGDSR